MKTKLSREYAVALYELACEAGETEPVRAALEQAKRAMEEQPDYAELLSSPGIPIAERLGLIDAAFSDAAPMALDFLKLLCEKNRVRELPACTDEYIALMDEAHRVSVATVTSARPLTEDERERLRAGIEKRTGRTVQLVCRVDGSLIGGMILEVDGTITDGSLRGRLNEIKDVIGG
ncbi:MAG: ATP synthase F1 subunit delta [Clostridia bacterium]|nr:ATP synthase F1 subunit delta [Clostridia bacterium]